MIERYKVVNCESLNVRENPSINAKIIKSYDKGSVVFVESGYSKKLTEINNATKKSTTVTWLKVKVGDKHYYMSNKYLQKINYLQLCADNADKVYKKIVELGCVHKSGARSYSEIVSKKATTCGVAVSAVMQLSGMVEVGKLVSHTAKIGDESNCVSKKNLPSKAITGIGNLKDGTCRVVKIGKKYADMPDQYKKKGIIYLYNSTIAMNAGNGYIYALLDVDYQKKGNKYVKNKLKGNCYPFTHKILYAIVPNH